MAAQTAFKRGLERLVLANEKGVHLAVMCSESDPALCHRSKLIGRELYVDYGIDMLHIVAPGKYHKESEVIKELTKSQWTPEPAFFTEEMKMPHFKSKKSYLQGSQETEYD